MRTETTVTINALRAIILKHDALNKSLATTTINDDLVKLESGVNNPATLLASIIISTPLTVTAVELAEVMGDDYKPSDIIRMGWAYVACALIKRDDVNVTGDFPTQDTNTDVEINLGVQCLKKGFDLVAVEEIYKAYAIAIR